MAKLIHGFSGDSVSRHVEVEKPRKGLSGWTDMAAQQKANEKCGRTWATTGEPSAIPLSAVRLGIGRGTRKGCNPRVCMSEG